MNRILLRTSLLLPALVIASCGFLPPGDAHPPMPPPHPDIPLTMSAPPPPAPAPTAADAEWQAIMDSLKQDRTLAEQQNEALADQHYQLAERYHQNGRFEQAELEVNQALKFNSKHLGARALLDDVRVALGRGVVTPQSQAIQRQINLERARRQQTLVEIGNAFQRGLFLFNDGKYGDAEDEFRRIVEVIKWLPTDVALEDYRMKAVDMLDKTRGAALANEIESEARRRKQVEIEMRADQRQRAMTEREQIEIMFHQAQNLFEDQRYVEALKVTERILRINPNLSTVQEMRLVTQRLRHDKQRSENLRNYIEEWKRTFEMVDRISLNQSEVFTYPDVDRWRLIKKRGPKRIQEREEDLLSEQDQAISNLLKTQPITLDLPAVELTEFITQLQSYTGVNFAHVGVDDPTVQVTAQLTDVTVENVLNIALEAVDLGWYIEDGVVLIVPIEVVLAKTRLEVYDVQDITYALQDFPGVDIALASNQIGVSTQTEEGDVTEFTADQLVELISNTIDRDNWDNEGRNIQAHQGLLIVRTISDVHAAISRLLVDFRASTGILVNIEARFLTVTDTFLEQIGMDFRDIDQIPIAFPGFPRQPTGILNADDINPAFNIPTRFFDPDGGGQLTNSSAGIVGSNGSSVTRPYGIRVQNIMMIDSILQRFLQTVWGTAGGLTLQYLLVDDVSVSAILKMVQKTNRGHLLSAPKLTLFNTQRGNTLISNQLAYIRDFNVQIGGAQIVPDPEIGVVNDGVSMDVRPIVSPDRRFITLELRPTVALLVPRPPSIATIPTVIGGIAQGGAQGRVIDIETPSIEVQRVRTTVVVPDRGTMIVGGLTIFFDTNSKAEVPLWRNIPILGWLGSERIEGRERQQLLILVRAEIIIPSEKEDEAF